MARWKASPNTTPTQTRALTLTLTLLHRRRWTPNLMISQVEAALWRRNMEVPFAMATLNVEELHALYTQLEGHPVPTPKSKKDDD